MWKTKKGQVGGAGAIVSLAIVVLIAGLVFVMGGTMMEKFIDITGDLVGTPSAEFNTVKEDSYGLMTTASGFANLLVVGVILTAVLGLLISVYVLYQRSGF